MQASLRRDARKIFTVTVTVGALFAGSALSARAAAFDSMYPTSNASWPCRSGGPGVRFCQTDNGSLNYGIEPGMTQAGRNDVYEVLGDEYGPTDLTVTTHFDGDIVYSGSGETDIILDWEDPVLDPGVYGQTWCNDAVDGDPYSCDQHYVTFDNMGGGSANPWKAVICHETGHAVGLTHGANAGPKQDQEASALGCMRTAADSESEAISWTDLGSHNTGEINDIYIKP